jgi:hypothetical protein
MNLRSFIFRVSLVALILATPSLWAQDGLRGAYARFETSADAFRDPFAQRLVAADFDQDQKPDGAVLLNGDPQDGQQGFRIELHVTAGENQKLSFTSSETALSLSVLDVNRDGTPDLVVEQTFTRKRVEIWLNDGRGLFRLANTEEYPSGSQLPVSWRAQVPPVSFLALYVSSRGSKDIALISELISGASHVTNQQLWSRVSPTICKPHAPNPSRGPPSSFAL